MMQWCKPSGKGKQSQTSRTRRNDLFRAIEENGVNLRCVSRQTHQRLSLAKFPDVDTAVVATSCKDVTALLAEAACIDGLAVRVELLCSGKKGNAGSCCLCKKNTSAARSQAACKENARRVLA